MIRVADKKIDGSGKEWVVSGSYEHPKWFDFELIRIEDGERGYFREYKEDVEFTRSLSWFRQGLSMILKLKKNKVKQGKTGSKYA